MAQTNKYPDLTYESVYNIYSVCQALKRDSNYINESPYSETIKKSLLLIFQNSQTQAPVQPISSSDLDIKVETEYLYRETKKILNSNILDEKDKAAVIKTATAQMEKLISLIERAENINQMREFEGKVLQVMKKVLPEKREEFIKEIARLEGQDVSTTK